MLLQLCAFPQCGVHTLYCIEICSVSAANVGDKLPWRSMSESPSVRQSWAPAGWQRLGFTAAPLVGVYFVCVRMRTTAADMLIRPCSSTQIRSDRPTRTALMRLLWVMLSDNRWLDSGVTPTSMTWRREKPLQASRRRKEKWKYTNLSTTKGTQISGCVFSVLFVGLYRPVQFVAATGLKAKFSFHASFQCT